jgi:hypothetical protein
LIEFPNYRNDRNKLVNRCKKLVHKAAMSCRCVGSTDQDGTQRKMVCIWKTVKGALGILTEERTVHPKGWSLLVVCDATVSREEAQNTSYELASLASCMEPWITFDNGIFRTRLSTFSTKAWYPGFG